MKETVSQLKVYIPEELHHQVKVKAAQEKISMSALVERLLKAWVEEKK